MNLHIPHTSYHIPEKIRTQFVLTDDELRQQQLKLTDAFTDELFNCTGTERVIFPYSRLLVDMERFPDDSEEPMSRVGMGRFYTRTTNGQPLRRTLKSDEVAVLDQYYTAHHQKLTDAVESELNHTGRYLLIDCHSFPSIPLPCDSDHTLPRPDFCIGTDAFHTPDALRDQAADILQREGYSVKINSPYSGALVPLKFYGKDKRVSSIMIEINRRLYMDEQTGKKINNFAAIQSVIRSLLERLNSHPIL